MESQESPLENSSVSVPKSQLKRSTFVKWAFVIGIALVANLFAYYVLQVLYPAPTYEAYCPAALNSEELATPEACTAKGGLWQANTPGPKNEADFCDVTYTCRQSFDAAEKMYARNAFVVFVAIGLILLLLSAFLKTVEAITSGLAFAGVLALLIGSLRYWGDMQDWLRVLVSGVALAGLIYFAWKKFKD